MSGSGGTNSPIALASHYSEPLSEGEEDDDEIIAAKDEEEETKRTGLSAEEVKAAVAHREKMLKERREEEEARKKERKSGKDRDKGYIESFSTLEIAHAADEMAGAEGEVSIGKNGKQPQFFSDTISRKLRTTALDINPLAPSSAFDETLKTKLAGARQREDSLRLRGKKNRRSSRNGGVARYGRRNDLAGDDEDGADDALEDLSGPNSQPDGDDRILERNWRAPKGKKIAVPVRVEPKVYFAAERTFLVCIFLFKLLCAEPFSFGYGSIENLTHLRTEMA